jgi:hyperosmotically inducible periplasmic protein
MKRIFFTIALFFGLFAASSEIASAQSASDSAKMEGSRISREIRKEILSLPYYGVFDAIGYEMKGDTVVLSGYTVRPLTKREAEAAVRDVEGVRNVVNNIEVLPLSPNDDRIRVRTYREIADKGALYRYLLGANPAIRIIVKNGRVTLEGFVASEADKNLATIAAKSVPGAFNVTNNLQVEDRIP